MRNAKYAIFLVVLVGCAPPISFVGGKVGDAQITFSAQGHHYVIYDYEGEALSTMQVGYWSSDSLFMISGEGGDGAGSSAQISFVVRSLPYISKFVYDLPDTGTFSLDLTLQAPSNSLIKINCPLLQGSASVALWPDTVGVLTDYTWFTDMKHTGILTITDLDTVNNLISGKFSFLAIDTSQGSSMADTVHIDSGIIYKAPINFY